MTGTLASIRDVESWEIKAAISERAAAIYYLAKPHSLPPLPEVVAIAHAAGIAVLVDAAAELPPVENLRRFISEGADLVVFSGGKAIGGPQGSGILCGRRDLIGAALIQQLDFDYEYEDWNPPADLIDKKNLPGVPRHGMGRSCKVGKEQIVGLLTALKLFVKEGNVGRHDRFMLMCQRLLQSGKGTPSLSARIMLDPERTGMPIVEIKLDEKKAGLDASKLLCQLRSGYPSVEVNPWRPEEGLLILSPACLREDRPAESNWKTSKRNSGRPDLFNSTGRHAIRRASPTSPRLSLPTARDLLAIHSQVDLKHAQHPFWRKSVEA